MPSLRYIDVFGCRTPVVVVVTNQWHLSSWEFCLALGPTFDDPPSHRIIPWLLLHRSAFAVDLETERLMTPRRVKLIKNTMQRMRIF